MTDVRLLPVSHDHEQMRRTVAPFVLSDSSYHFVRSVAGLPVQLTSVESPDLRNRDLSISSDGGGPIHRKSLRWRVVAGDVGTMKPWCSACANTLGLFC